MFPTIEQNVSNYRTPHEKNSLITKRSRYQKRPVTNRQPYQNTAFYSDKSIVKHSKFKPLSTQYPAFCVKRIPVRKPPKLKMGFS